MTTTSMKNKQFEDTFENAEDYALKLLRFRQTRRSLITKLMGKKYSRDTAEAVADKMEHLGYIDDLDFARALVHDGTLISRYGKNKIRTMLFTKGIDKQTAENALQYYYDVTVDEENLKYFALRSFGAATEISGVDAEKFRRKMLARGFSHRQISETLANYDVLSEEEY